LLSVLPPPFVDFSQSNYRKQAGARKRLMMYILAIIALLWMSVKLCFLLVYYHRYVSYKYDVTFFFQDTSVDLNINTGNKGILTNYISYEE
jgi:hypothetical protein